MNEVAASINLMYHFPKRVLLEISSSCKKALKRKTISTKDQSLTLPSKNFIKKCLSSMTKQFLSGMITLNLQFVIIKAPSPFMLLPKKRLKGHSFVLPLITDSGDMAISDLDEANTLNSVFHKCY